MSTYTIVSKDGSEIRLNALKFAQFAGESSTLSTDANNRLILTSPLFYWKVDGKWHYEMEPFHPTNPMIEH